MLPDAKVKIIVRVPWVARIVEVEITLDDYEFDVWEAKQSMKMAHNAKFEGLIRLKKNSPNGEATKMLNQISNSTDFLAFFIC